MVVCDQGARHAPCAPPPALSARPMTRHNQPARAAAARTFLASPEARGGAHLDTQCHADRIPPDTRRVHRASCGTLPESRRQRPLPADPHRDTVHPMMQQQ